MRRWATPALYGLLALELAGVVVFAAIYKSLDFSVYMWGGRAVTHDTRLYLVQGIGHWFTYPPFAAIVFTPISVLPLALARVLWDLVSVAAFAYCCVLTLRLAGREVTKKTLVTFVAGGLLLEPVYQTLFLGQINLILLALILTDVWRASRGRPAGIGVGIAAAIKLTPGIFIVFFLLARRTKAALTAVAAFAGCGLIAYLVAPGASKLYWRHLFYDTKRVGAPYISNQSPYGAAIRIAGGVTHIGAWYPVIPAVIGVIGLAAATVLVRHHDWLGATATTGATGLLVSPISWAHHWAWVLLALVVLRRGGSRSRAAAAFGYALFVLSPLWWTPHSGGPHEYGFHGLLTAVANCYLLAGLAFLAYMAWQAYLTWRTGAVPGAGDGDHQAADVRAAEPVTQGIRHEVAADQPAR